MANKINCFRALGLIIFSLWGTLTFGQSEHKILLEGTRAYQKGDYQTAAQKFRTATESNTASTKSNFNLGNAYFKTKKYEEAVNHYQTAITNANDTKMKSKAYYNLGNSYLAQAKKGMKQTGNTPPQLGEKGEKQLKNAIEAYKDALRNNSQDYNAKNNLGMAYKMLRQQQQQQQNQQQDKQDQQDKEQQDKNKDDQKEKQDQDQKDSKDESPAEEEKDKPVDNSNEMTEGKAKDLEQKEIERMLRQIEEEDKKVQEKLMKRKKTNSNTIEKDW